ncbi:hypothetical protein IW140_000563 [Coemansia sp. RSA 1813]|nr:hypothetical protein EV178_002707 [Coemansia sp. RSA 1646]KAJ1774031.1 hypothetical protein LPJ74_000130 [Coemansia sp. RSA 1843]KAJ2092579.1 hypothetical protein IW138_001017 [Coemansia sp. RSA 986]KAJ2216727.1 hypothetical protein EV179_001017 [Coemansia sp. RSA 487]KAJ2572800.1 hypothetical protein IW140_000563 [Coemansia sp. RSA 1813]
MVPPWLFRVAAVLLTVLGFANLYFYNYARIHAMFHPTPDIRLNLYGDPQIEGDAKLQREPRTGWFDILVNDYYLHHVYGSTIAAFKPNYVVTMGDIFSSQWVKRSEYYKRIERFKWISQRVDGRNKNIQSSHMYLYLAGNHDIGYGDETRPYHINRFVNNFGPLNRKWTVDIHGRLHRMAILNAMSLDKTRMQQYRTESWDFVHGLAADSARYPDIPLVLFLHIPLYKHDGVCVANAKTVHRDGFVRYQDYLSPATSAYLLHCLAPVLVFNGHDHNGCVAGHSTNVTASIPTALRDSGKTLTSISDMCDLTLEELDMYQPELDEFALSTTSSTAGSAVANSTSFSTIEITVRSSMGAYHGTTGIFDISSDRQQHPATSNVRVFGRSAQVNVGGYTYSYREIPFGHHLVVRILLISNIISCFAIPAMIFFA